MKLNEKIKTALDETRMLILGANILLGFQLRSAFSEGFDALSPHARGLSGLSLGCLTCVVALLIAPNPYHRLVENGDDSGYLHELVTRYAGLALLPFAIALGLDIFVVIESAFGAAAALTAGAAASVSALFAWYALPWLARRTMLRPKRRSRMPTVDRRQPTAVHTKIEQALTEARVIIPGAQAVLGFQLSIILTQPFAQLPLSSQLVHAACMGLITLSVILLMAPAAYHRIVFDGEESQHMYRVASNLVTVATAPLAFGLAGDIYVVIAKITDPGIGLASASLSALLLFGLWYAYPLAASRWMRRAAPRKSRHGGKAA